MNVNPNRFVTKSELARLSGVSRAAIGKLCSNRLADAFKDGRIDIEHPAVVGYLQGRNKRSESPAAAEPPPGNLDPMNLASSPQLPPPPASGAGTSRYELENFKLQQQGFKLHLENAERVGQLVTREAVIVGFYQPCEQLFVQLLTDFTKSTAGIIIPMVQGGASRLEVEAKIRSNVSNFLGPCKRKMHEAVDAIYGAHEAEAAHQ